MQRALRSIPDFELDNPRWSDLRGRIYTWAFQHHAEIRRLRETWAQTHAERYPDLKNRQWETTQVYIVLADHIGGQPLVDRILAFLTEYFIRASKAREESDRQVTLLKSLPRVIATVAAHPGYFYSVKDIHQVASSYLEEDSREFYKTRAVTRHIVTLGFPKSQTAKGGRQVQILEEDARRAFRRLHVIPFDEDVEWLEGRIDYQTGVPIEPTPEPEKPKQESLDWLESYDEVNTL
jgi:hypothetical protein